MSSVDQNETGDRVFERTLLQSATLDGPSPEATQEAWSAFVGAASGVAGLSLENAPGVRNAKAVRAARIAAAKWLVIGALGGSALTAALLMTSRYTATQAPLQVVTAVAPATATFVRVPVLVAPTAGAPASPESDTAQPTASPRRALRHPAPAGRVTSRELTTSPSAGSVRLPATSDSSLAAEVAALDAARTASQTGAFDETLRLIDRYHHDFPAGELGADADVVAIEALSGRGDRTAASERAARFLARYPNDPHAAEVRSLRGAF